MPSTLPLASYVIGLTLVSKVKAQNTAIKYYLDPFLPINKFLCILWITKIKLWDEGFFH